MGRLIEDAGLRQRAPVFKDRTDAGRHLAENLRGYEASGALVLAIGLPLQWFALYYACKLFQISSELLRARVQSLAIKN